MIEKALRYIHGFLFRIGCFHVGNEIAGRILRPQRLAFAHFIVRHDRAGGGKNVLGRTIVLLELDDPHTREVFFKRENVLDVSAAPAIDGLVFVAHDTDIVVHAREVANEQVLLPIRVLVLVNHHIWKSGAVLFRRRWKLVE